MSRRRWAVVVALLLVGPYVAQASASLVLYHDRALFNAALQGLAPFTDDYESYALGPIPLGGRLGDFFYEFDPNTVQPAVAGGKALGGASTEVFVGGDSVTLSYQALPPAPSTRLFAFGADFVYAPSFDTIPADTYRLGIEDGAAAGQFVGNLPLADSGGTFFLGVISHRPFTNVSLSSVQLDPGFLVPAYQVDNLIYAVPEPHTIWLVALGGVVLFVSCARRRKPTLAKR